MDFWDGSFQYRSVCFYSTYHLILKSTSTQKELISVFQFDKSRSDDMLRICHPESL